MLQFYIPEVVSVEQVFDKSDEVTAKEFTKLEEKIMTKSKVDEKWCKIEWNTLLLCKWNLTIKKTALFKDTESFI